MLAFVFAGKSRFAQQLVEDISSKFENIADKLPMESRASPQTLPKAGMCKSRTGVTPKSAPDVHQILSDMHQQ